MGTEKEIYEVDLAMMGHGWEKEDIRPFTFILQAIVGGRVKIKPVTDSHNGAYNKDPDLVSEEEWIKAMNGYISAEK